MSKDNQQQRSVEEGIARLRARLAKLEGPQAVVIARSEHNSLVGVIKGILDLLEDTL